MEYNNNQTETRRHYSYSEQNDKWETLKDDKDFFENISLKDAIEKLEPQQQKLVKDIYYNGMSMSDIARRDGVNKSSITKRMRLIIKRLKNNFKKF